MDGLVECPFHSNDDETIIISTLLMSKRIDPDFSVQSVNEIHIIKFEAFALPGFHATRVYDRLRYFFSAFSRDGTKKAEWIIQPLPRVKSLRIANQHSTSDFRNHVAENTLSEVELQLVPSHVSAFTLEIMLQIIYGMNVCNDQVTIRLVIPEIMLQKTCF